MAYIKVDHGELLKTANAIDSYITKHKNNMKQINNKIVGLNSSWQGKDYNQLKTEWIEIMSADSTSGRMLKSLENYSDALRYAAKEYMDAQASAINRANLLPR